MTRDGASTRIGLYIALVSFVADILIVSWFPNFDFLVLLFVIVPLAILIFVALAIWSGKKAAVPLGTMLLICLVATYASGRYSAFLRSEIRWWSSRPVWKQGVLAQQNDPSQLKHIDWDGWGMFAQDTEVYLVYDPTDQLRNTTNISNGKHAPGLPCDVWNIWRLEPHWYNVVFFTNTSWDSCP